MPIEFSCPNCRQMVRTPDQTAGRKGKCPQCKAVVQIPSHSTFQQVHATPSPTASSAAMQVASVSASGQSIQFFCFACGKLIRTTTAVAGKRGRCPHCQEIVQVPHGDRMANEVAPPAARDELVPLPNLTPLPHRPKPKTHPPSGFPDPLFGMVPGSKARWADPQPGIE